MPDIAESTVSGGVAAVPMEQKQAEPEAKVTLLFDLDGTLYPQSNGYTKVLRRKMFAYMTEKLGMGENPELVWKPLFAKYNQTLRSLKAGGYQVDDEEFWRVTREGAEPYVKPCPPEVKSTLEKLAASSKVKEMHIFTNCNELEAKQLLQVLGLSHLFSKVYGAAFMGDCCKPEKSAFDLVLGDLGITAEQVCFFEDSYKNLVTANEMGMKTVLVTSVTLEEEGVQEAQLALVSAVIRKDVGITEEELRPQLPELFEVQGYIK